MTSSARQHAYSGVLNALLTEATMSLHICASPFSPSSPPSSPPGSQVQDDPPAEAFLYDVGIN